MGREKAPDFLKDGLQWICDNCLVTSSMTPAQLPRASCRKIVIVGYQGESGRLSNHLQSPAKRFRSHVGFPIAPARCATAVSTLMIKSSVVIKPAVSAKSIGGKCCKFGVFQISVPSSCVIVSCRLKNSHSLCASNSGRRELQAQMSEIGRRKLFTPPPHNPYSLFLAGP